MSKEAKKFAMIAIKCAKISLQICFEVRVVASTEGEEYWVVRCTQTAPLRL